MQFKTHLYRSWEFQGSGLSYKEGRVQGRLEKMDSEDIKPRALLITPHPLEGAWPAQGYQGGRPCVQFSSVTQSCVTLCDPMNRSTPGLPVHHQLPEFTQTNVSEYQISGKTIE